MLIANLNNYNLNRCVGPQLHSGEYVSVIICMVIIFIALIALYVIFFKWVFEVENLFSRKLIENSLLGEPRLTNIWTCKFSSFQLFSREEEKADQWFWIGGEK